MIENLNRLRILRTKFYEPGTVQNFILAYFFRELDTNYLKSHYFNRLATIIHLKLVHVAVGYCKWLIVTDFRPFFTF